MENYTKIFWVLFALSLSVFFFINLLLLYCVQGRLSWSIRTEHIRAKNTAAQLTNPQGAEEFRKEIGAMTQIVGIFLAITSSLTFAAAVASFSAERKRLASIVVSISSALPTLCFALFLKMLDDAKPDAQVCLEDQKRYMEALLFKAFFIRRVGYRLFFFTAALSAGWIHTFAMFGATLVLVLIYVIIDIRAYIVSHQTTHIQNDAAKQVETH